jgi:hypothetical protein
VVYNFCKVYNVGGDYGVGDSQKLCIIICWLHVHIHLLDYSDVVKYNACIMYNII